MGIKNLKIQMDEWRERAIVFLTARLKRLPTDTEIAELFWDECFKKWKEGNTDEQRS